MEAITRTDVVGQAIACIYKTDDYVEADGYGGSTVYVELKNGVFFRLPFYEERFVREDKLGLFGKLNVWVRPEPDEPMVVADVIRSESWLTLGLLLVDGRCLVMDCWP